MKTLWDIQNVADIPKEMRPAVERELKRVEHLIPRWCECIRVQYMPNPQDALERGGNASIVVNVEYRCAFISILPKWFDLPDEQRHETLLHEVSHIPTRATFDLLHSIIDNCVSDEGAQKVLREQVRVVVESATEDISKMLYQAMQRAA